MIFAINLNSIFINGSIRLRFSKKNADKQPTKRINFIENYNTRIDCGIIEKNK